MGILKPVLKYHRTVARKSSRDSRQTVNRLDGIYDCLVTPALSGIALSILDKEKGAAVDQPATSSQVQRVSSSVDSLRSRVEKCENTILYGADRRQSTRNGRQGLNRNPYEQSADFTAEQDAFGTPSLGKGKGKGKGKGGKGKGKGKAPTTDPKVIPPEVKAAQSKWTHRLIAHCKSRDDYEQAPNEVFNMADKEDTARNDGKYTER